MKKVRASVEKPGAYKHRRDKYLKLGGPFLFFFIGLAVLYILYPGSKFLVIFGLMIAYFVPPAGKETIIPLGILALNLNWVLVALVITFADIVTALFFVWNFDYAKKVPILGPWITNFEKKNSNIMSEKKWLQGMTYVGLVFFVFVPLQGTEAVGGSVLGRILGLKPWTVFSAILFGSLTGSLATAYISVTIGTALFGMFATTLAKVILGIILLIAFASISFFLWWFRKKKDAKKAAKPKDEEE
jgi:uncharacterized membrane protein